MGLSVSGLVNGIDVPTVVGQLMQSEQIPQQMLQSQQTTVNLQASTYRSINTKFQAVLSAAQALTSSATWTATTASASASSVAVASTGTTQPGSLTFAVTSTAAAKSVITQQNPPYSSTTAVFGSSIEVYDGTGTVDRGPITIGGSGTLSDAVTAINSSGYGLTAAIVQTATGQYQLQVTSTTTGTASDFSLGSQFATVTPAADAALKVGTGPGAYTVTSATNTFTGLMPGVTLTVSQKEASVTVGVASDPKSVGDKMKALIDAANAAIQEISKDTDTGVGNSNTSGKAGPLAGDYSMQSLAQQVRNIVSSAVGTLGSASQAGVQLANPLDPTTGDPGTINFDEDTFVAALKSDPSLVQSLIKGIPADNSTTPPTPAVAGIAAQLATLAQNSTDSVTGTLTALANGQDALSKNLQSQIDDWTTRLADIKQQLTRTYTNMESMLASLQNQQSWMSSMFNSLTGSSSSSSSSSSS